MPARSGCGNEGSQGLPQTTWRKHFCPENILLPACYCRGALAGLACSAVAGGQSSTALSAAKTATAFFERTIYYRWTVQKYVDPTSLTSVLGASGVVTYTINATHSWTAMDDVYGVRDKSA